MLRCVLARRLGPRVLSGQLQEAVHAGHLALEQARARVK
jgi:hypothetical protein